MSVWQILFWIAGIYLTLGIICAYINFSNVEERKKLVDSIQKIRKFAFEEGISLEVSLTQEDVSWVGMDPEDFRKDLDIYAQIIYSPKALSYMLALIMMFIWPYVVKTVVEDRIMVRTLKKMRNGLIVIVYNRLFMQAFSDNKVFKEIMEEIDKIEDKNKPDGHKKNGK